MRQSKLRILAAAVVACGMLVSTPGAAGAAGAVPPGHPGPPAPRYEPQPRFQGSPAPWGPGPGRPGPPSFPPDAGPGPGHPRPPRIAGPGYPGNPGPRSPGPDRPGGRPPGPPPRPVAPFPADAARAVVWLVNAERARVGCAPVRPRGDLMMAARGHSEAMARSGRLSHHEADGSDLSDRMAEAGYGYRLAAENVTSGAPSPAAAVDSWMASPGHRRHIVQCAFDHVGVGVSFAPGGPWWTLLLARPH